MPDIPFKRRRLIFYLEEEDVHLASIGSPPVVTQEGLGRALPDPTLDPNVNTLDKRCLQDLVNRIDELVAEVRQDRDIAASDQQDVVKLVQELKSELTKPRPDRSTLTSVINAIAALGNPERVLELIQRAGQVLGL